MLRALYFSTDDLEANYGPFTPLCSPSAFRQVESLLHLASGASEFEAFDGRIASICLEVNALVDVIGKKNYVPDAAGAAPDVGAVAV